MSDKTARGIGVFKKNRIAREEAIIVSENNSSYHDECYNRLKDNLTYYSDGGKHKVIQVESSISGDGKTTLSCNLAVSLSYNKKRVALVDMDFRRPRIHRVFNILPDNGLTEFMTGKISIEETIKHSSYGVDIVSVGSSVVHNSSLIITSEKMREMIEYLKANYDFVILDCPPVLMISDYINIAKLSDGILFVFAYGYTRKTAVRESISLLKKTGTPIIGSAMTFAQRPKHGKYGYYGYGYGYYGESHEEVKKQ